MRRKRLTKQELRETLNAFLPPNCNAEWADDLENVLQTGPTTKANALAIATRETMPTDDLQPVEARNASASNVGDEDARHPDEGRNQENAS